VTHATPGRRYRQTVCRAAEIEFEYVDDQCRDGSDPAPCCGIIVFKAIGQTLQGDALRCFEARKIKVDGTGRTSVDGVWAGGGLRQRRR